jgi:hypothetical protein
MAARKKAAAGSANPYSTSGDPGDLSPDRRIAHDILLLRGDLLPSIDRIMGAGLGEDATVRALTLFRTAVEHPGDPNRDPRSAIAAATR